MEICSYFIIGWERIENRWIFFFILIGYDYILNSRELLSWMCANLNVSCNQNQ